MRSTFALLALALTSLLSGCAVASVAGTAIGLAATAASITVDAAVGTAKVIGNAVTPSKAEDK